MRRVLEDNILRYWLTLKDPQGGFSGEVLSDGTILYDAPRGVILNARIIWAFAAAYGAIGNKEYLDAAIHAAEYFMEKFCDHKYGGVFWSVDSKGEMLDTKKQLMLHSYSNIIFLKEIMTISPFALM